MFNDKLRLTEAVLKGVKTQTRRIISQEQKIRLREEYGDDPKRWVCGAQYYEGLKVAVAQRYSEILDDLPKDIARTIPDYYKQFGPLHPGWRNKMFIAPQLMPHVIRITNVRVQRLQDITDDDCIAEGVRKGPFGYYVDGLEKKEPYYINADGSEDRNAGFATRRQAFAALIDRISGKGTWAKDPWVFVYDFTLLR